MAWARIDDQFYLNPKNGPIDRDEQDLLLASYVYCNGQLTDGFIPNGKLSLIAIWAKLPDQANAQAIASRLVEHCFWEIAEGGYVIHDFLDWNMSRVEVLALKAARSEAGRRGGLKSVASRQANAKQVLEQKSSKTQPNTHTNTNTINLKDSHTSEPANLSENPTVYKLITDLTGWMAIPPSEENTQFMRDLPTIIQRKGEDSKIYLQGFWNTWKDRYPGSTRLGWIGWAMTGQIPSSKPSKNGKKPDQPDHTYARVTE